MTYKGLFSELTSIAIIPTYQQSLSQREKKKTFKIINILGVFEMNNIMGLSI